MKVNKEKELIDYINSGDWVDWSCGRSTDYIDVFWEEGSKNNLINKIKELRVREDK